MDELHLWCRWLVEPPPFARLFLPAFVTAPNALYAREMSLFARATQPLQNLDGPVNCLNDLTVRVTPWMWWPASPPQRYRPYDAGQHAAYLAWTAAGFLAGDALAKLLPEEQRSTGRRLRNERIVTGLMSAVLWLVAVGAWDRRAERLRRRPWRRSRR